MLAKVISKQKLIYYDAKSLKLVYLLKLAVFPHEAHIVTDLRAVKSDQRHPALYSGLPCSYRQTTIRQKAASLSAFPDPLSLMRDGHACITDRVTPLRLKLS